jgi:acyl-CoA reductase-like NAD-dependent aldehyde dehydrogenase
MFTKKAFESLKLGDPMDPSTNIGPIAMPEGPEILVDYCNDAVSMGGSLLLGGNMNTDDKGLGRFFEPTIIANSNNGMKAVQEQIFGPIVCF